MTTPTDPRVLVERDTVRFAFMEGSWENSRAPTIVRDDPAGGDPHILGSFARVYNPEALYELCRLANAHLPMTKIKASSVVRFCFERAGTFGALRKSSLTAMALDEAAATITRLTEEVEAMREEIVEAIKDIANEHGAQGYGRDVLNQKALTVALRDLEHRFRATLDRSKGE